MNKRNIFIIIAILKFGIINSQSNNRIIYNEIFKWSFSIPDTFENVGLTETEKNQALGKEMIEKELGQKVVNKSIKIYGFKNGIYNQLIVNYQLTQSTDNYELRFKEVCEILYESLKTKLPTANITHSFSSEFISNIKFETFDLQISANNIKMNIKSFSTIIDDKILNIQIGYQDNTVGEKLIAAIRESTFTK